MTPEQRVEMAARLHRVVDAARLEGLRAERARCAFGPNGVPFATDGRALVTVPAPFFDGDARVERWLLDIAALKSGKVSWRGWQLWGELREAAGGPEFVRQCEACEACCDVDKCTKCAKCAGNGRRTKACTLCGCNKPCEACRDGIVVPPARLIRFGRGLWDANLWARWFWPFEGVIADGQVVRVTCIDKQVLVLTAGPVEWLFMAFRDDGEEAPRLKLNKTKPPADEAVSP